MFPDFNHPTHMTSRESANRQLDPEGIDHLFDLATNPPLLLTKTAFRELDGAPECWLGGLPTLPKDIEHALGSTHLDPSACGLPPCAHSTV